MIAEFLSNFNVRLCSYTILPSLVRDDPSYYCTFLYSSNEFNLPISTGFFFFFWSVSEILASCSFLNKELHLLSRKNSFFFLVPLRHAKNHLLTTFWVVKMHTSTTDTYPLAHTHTQKPLLWPFLSHTFFSLGGLNYFNYIKLSGI